MRILVQVTYWGHALRGRRVREAECGKEKWAKQWSVATLWQPECGFRLPCVLELWHKEYNWKQSGWPFAAISTSHCHGVYVCVCESEREREREREGERERERWDAVRQVIFLKPPEKWFLLAGQSFQITNKQKQKTELLIIALNPHSGHLVKEIWAGQQEPPLQQWFPWSSRSIACESWIANSRILAETYWIRSAGGGAWQLGTWIFQKILIYAQVGDPLPLPKTFKMGARKFKLLIKSEQKQQSVITGAKFLGLWENFMQLQAAS